MINRLWVRLSIAFALMIFLSTLIIFATTAATVAPTALQNVFLAELVGPGGLVSDLSIFYAKNGSWADLNDFWAQRNRVITVAPAINVAIVITDLNGVLVSGQNNLDQDNSPMQFERLPILVNGEVKGYVQLRPTDLQPPISGLGTLFAQRVSATLLTFTLVTGVISIIFGALLSRSLTAPLNRLAEAARLIGVRKQYHPVKVAGTTEVRALARSFNDMTDALGQAETLRRNMVADVAHELRTPLSVLQGNLRAILDDVYPMSKDEISALYNQTVVLGRLVNDLHELSQAEAAKLRLNLQPTDLSALIGEQIATFSTIAEADGVELTFSAPPDLPLLIIDPVRITQTVGNLVSNALAHTPAGGRISVALSRTTAPQGVSITVQDTGEGIAAEHLPYVFERFYRADASRARKTGGAGLGLAIALALVEAHGGTLRATSAGIAGRGSTFEIVLPLRTHDPKFVPDGKSERRSI